MGIFDTHESKLLTRTLLERVATSLSSFLEDDSHNVIQLLKGRTNLADLKAVEKRALDISNVYKIVNQVPSR